MVYEINLYKRPKEEIVNRIKEISESLPKKSFFENIPANIENDLKFQDTICLCIDDKIVAFIVFTSFNASIHITYMGIDNKYLDKGYEVALLKYFCTYVKSIGFESIKVLTVPPEVENSFQKIVDFYTSNGFIIRKRYFELWESGALELIKILEDS